MRLDTARDEYTKEVKVYKKTKWTSPEPFVNKIYMNYGTMLDFFDYSGVRV